MLPTLGRLERIDLRAVWESEASSFTPWLALPENLSLLGDTIGISLELEAQEKNVGPFRADLLCKDTASGAWVLIENQIERTDHTHLGQILTYAAGLDAVSIVWVARRFTEEHRAALDWLNRVTEPKINFFGLEVEVWRIGASAPAPKFNIVSQPNDWAKLVATSVIDGQTETKQQQLAFWTAFREHLIENDSLVKPQKPQAQHWATFSVGKSGFHLEATLHSTLNRITALLVIEGREETKAYFHLLEQQKADIEREIDAALDWALLPDKGESRIRLSRTWASLFDETRWPEQFNWLKEKLEAFYHAFAPRVKNLDAGDWATDALDPEPSEWEPGALDPEPSAL